MSENEGDQLAEFVEKLNSEEMLNQPCWSYIKEVNSVSDERLDSIAIRDGYRTYTYRQMFRHWERYAEAFSGVGLTRENKSRVALIGTPNAETIFAFYGLNMTGASVSNIYHLDLYDEKQMYSMIERENITDLLIAEVWAFPKLMKRLLRDREMLGLRNVIVLESPHGGDYAVPVLEFIRKLNRALFRELDGGLLMVDLLKEYEATPISYGDKKSYDDSVILHTTGTVNGMHKPVPLSDRALNAFIPCAIKTKETYDDFQNLPDHLVSCLTLNMSWVYAMVDMLHMPFGLGMELVCLPWGGTNPRYAEAIEEYGFNVLFTSKSILDSWLKTTPDMDLSKLKIVFMGGTYVSPDYKEKFNSYLRSCGSSARIINGYGLSELGGACAISPSTRDDDAIGFPLPGFKVKIYVEDDDCYYDLSDGPHTGILLISSKTISSGRLDSEVFFELEDIDGEEYFNTNDLVRVNEDGSMTCIGRSNQFFINNAGVRFDAGLVQTAVTAQPGIVSCGLAPEFQKILHDNIPVLYVETDTQGPNELAVLHDALVQVFVKDDMLADSNMPSQAVFVDHMPLNAGGKVDSKRLASGTVSGRRFSVKPVRVNEKIVDVVLVPAAEGEFATMGAGMPEELENDPYAILSELFAIIPDLNDGDYRKILRLPGFRELVLKLTDFDIGNIPRSMMKSAPKMFELAFKKYVLPIMKGDNKMSKKQAGSFGFAPLFPLPPVPMFPMGFGDDEKKQKAKKQAKELEDNMKSFLEKGFEMHKSSKDAAKDQWNMFFADMMEMEDMFADSLPDEFPTLPLLPPCPVSPKDIVKSMKEFQEMTNSYFLEQADAKADFAEQTRQKAVDKFEEAKQAVAAQAEAQAEEAEQVEETEEVEEAEE